MDPVSYTHLDVYKRQVLTLIELEMDQHVTKELAREIMTNYYGEADETQISDYGTICIWEDADNDRRFVLIPDEYDRYVVEITSLSSGESSVVETEIPVLEESTGAAAENGDAGEFGKMCIRDSLKRGDPADHLLHLAQRQQ